MTEETKKQNEVTPEGTVEINEEDLDQASGGASILPTAQVKLSPTLTQTQKFVGDGSVKPTYDLNVSKPV